MPTLQLTTQPDRKLILHQLFDFDLNPRELKHMNPWIKNPEWQNFSSMFREAITAKEAKTGMERSHHLTASLYFGIAAIEAFLNQKMRAHLKGNFSEEKIIEILRKKDIISKVKKWPSKLIGKPLKLRHETAQLIKFFNDIRGDLTHPKTHGHEIYSTLETIDPDSIIDTIAECIVRYHEAEGLRYPYWLFGWNFLNPRPDSYEIILINNQKFLFSLQAIGFQVPASAYTEAEAWSNRYLKTFDGYLVVKQKLNSSILCEPKFDRFPYRPILCKRWWVAEHHRSCGNVTEEALNYARNYGAKPIHQPNALSAGPLNQILNFLSKLRITKK